MILANQSFDVSVILCAGQQGKNILFDNMPPTDRKFGAILVTGERLFHGMTINTLLTVSPDLAKKVEEVAKTLKTVEYNIDDEEEMAINFLIHKLSVEVTHYLTEQTHWNLECPLKRMNDLVHILTHTDRKIG